MPAQNIYLGSSSIDFSNVNEKGTITVPEFDSYLSNIEYVVTINFDAGELSNILQNVGINYSVSGQDFANADGATDNGTVFPWHFDTTKATLDFSTCDEVIGRHPALLSGLYDTHRNAGADDIVLVNRAYPTVGSNVLAMDGAMTTEGDIRISMNSLDGANVACGAVARAIGGQMEGFASDEALLRLVSTAESYNNLLTFLLQGSKESSGASKNLTDELKGKMDYNVDRSAYSVKELVEMNDDIEEISAKCPGDKVIAAIFNLYPPNENTYERAPTVGKLWCSVEDLTNTDGHNVGDVIKINDSNQLTELLQNDLILKYVLRTKMTLMSKFDIALNHTFASPARATNPEVQSDDEVHILFNLRFI
jgi:hypothetical protein